MDPNKKQEYLAKFNFPHCNLSTRYEKLNKIGQGTYGEVFKARDKTNPTKLVAMKKIIMDDSEGFPITTLRELKILQALKHHNVVNLIEVCRTHPDHSGGTSNFYLIFDYCELDLYILLSNNNILLSLGEIKKILQQMLNGLFFIHGNKVLHRDLKPSNILLTRNGVLKIADFGLARPFSIHKDGSPTSYTPTVVTLWYRPPELLLGERNYGPAVDMWSFGCIMTELWTRFPIMQGDTEQKQIIFISKLCGSLLPDVWPNVERLPLYRRLYLPTRERRKLRESLAVHVSVPQALDLIDKLLTLDPVRRMSADEALNDSFFWSEPLPCDLKSLVTRCIQSLQGAVSKTPSTSYIQDSEYQDRIY